MITKMKKMSALKTPMFVILLLLILPFGRAEGRCDDSEPGKSLAIRGQVNYEFTGDPEVKFAEDSCDVDIPNLLYEWFCDGTIAKYDMENCEDYGMVCDHGECHSCSDSDGGLSYYTYGWTRGPQDRIEEDSCRDDFILEETYCDGNGNLRKESKACNTLRSTVSILAGFDLICLDGRCQNNPCTDTEPLRDIRVKGKVTYNQRVYMDTCRQGEGFENILYQYFCESGEAKLEEIDCANQGMECMEGKCVDTSYSCQDSDPKNDPFKRGRISYGDISVVADQCSGEDKLFQFDCAFPENEISNKSSYCSHIGAFCYDGFCKSCPAGTTFVGGRCGVQDYDGDGILDIVEDKCLDTIQGDAINDDGCSCQQGAVAVNLFINGAYRPVNCDSLIADQTPCSKGGPLSNPSVTEGHCCNSIKDSDEYLVDCGGQDCKPCTGMCTNIAQPDGGLGILFVPIKYSSSRDPSVVNNMDDWRLRTEDEARKITWTPPFDNGNVAIWRLDIFGKFQYLQYPESRQKVGSVQVKDLKRYATLCPSIDVVSFLPSTVGGSYAQKDSGLQIVYREELPELNAVVHEMGHSFCGLDDEYEGDTNMNVIKDAIGTFVESSINCDRSPITYTLPDNTTEKRCKWHNRFPDAGCIPGCFYSDKWYRPENFFEDSMMNDNYQVGPTKLGLGTWNIVGYARCKELVDQYAS